MVFNKNNEFWLTLQMHRRGFRNEQGWAIILCGDVVGHSCCDRTSCSYLIKNISKIFAHSQTTKERKRKPDTNNITSYNNIVNCIRYLKLSKRELKSSKSNCELLGAIDELCISLKVGSLVFRWILKRNNFA